MCWRESIWGMWWMIVFEGIYPRNVMNECVGGNLSEECDEWMFLKESIWGMWWMNVLEGSIWGIWWINILEVIYMRNVMNKLVLEGIYLRNVMHKCVGGNISEECDKWMFWGNLSEECDEWMCWRESIWGMLWMNMLEGIYLRNVMTELVLEGIYMRNVMNECFEVIYLRNVMNEWVECNLSEERDEWMC